MSASEERTMHPLVHNLLGQQFGRLVVTEQAASIPGGQARWRCRCQCGGETTVPGSNLRRGLVLSCGCLQHERARDASTTHAHVGTPEHRIWRNIKGLCFCPTNRQYPNNGGRGITMDERWRDSFEAFIADVGYRPSPHHRLMRRDLNDNFTADNTEWRLPKGVRTKGHL